VRQKVENSGMPAGRTTFGLVHGAWHGAWCWDRLVPELEARGFPCVAVDLPVEDPAQGGREYASMMHDALGPGADDVVLVGHSMGGLVIPLVATLRLVRLLIFIAAFVPEPGRSMTDQLRDGGTFAATWPALAARQTGHPDGSSEWPPDAAIEAFYPDCTPEDARWAARRLRRQTWTVLDETTPLEIWPPAGSVSILCRDDRVISADWARRVALERFGKPAIELDGGHSPFLARPAELADLLAALATPSPS
jgi:pimeloyl-ACP methyl ester carboxylesterase